MAIWMMALIVAVLLFAAIVVVSHFDRRRSLRYSEEPGFCRSLNPALRSTSEPALREKYSILCYHPPRNETPMISESASQSPPGRGTLVLDHIDKNFEGSSVPALRNVSITTMPGEFVVVVGPSGCGKSTLLNIAAGMLKPDGGRCIP